MENKPIKAEHAKESGHWYDREGNDAYTIIGKNGNERPTTLADARKLNLVPSVTTIINLMASPALNNWIAENLLMSALTTDRKEGESEAEYIARIKTDAKEQSEKAKENGTRIHALVQQGFEGEKLNAEAYRYYISAKNELESVLNNDLKWFCEKSFANERYGGKIDLLNDEYIIDIKTTSKPLEGIKTWDSHALQLSAYRGQGKQKCGILYLNVDSAEAKLLMLEEKELERGFRMFKALVDLFYAKSGLEEK